MGLVFLTTTYNLSFVYGITITFSSIFIFLILRIYGLSAAVTTGLLACLFIPKEISFIAHYLITILEVIFVGLFFLKGRKAKMFYVDVLFWGLLGGFMLFFLNRELLVGYTLYFQICKDIINALVNILIADMLLAYFPFYRLLNSNRVNKNHVSIHQFLSHITLVSVLLPFYISVSTNTFNTYESISKNVSVEARNHTTRIAGEIRDLNPNGIENPSVFTEILSRYQTNKYDVVIERDAEVIASTNIQASITTKEMSQNYSGREITDHFYELLPKVNEKIQPIHKWEQGKYIYVREEDEFTILFQYPISYFQNQIFKISMEQSKYILFIVLFLYMLLLGVTRMLTNNLKQLTVVTTGLPQKLLNLENIEWPQSSIKELQVLGKNLRKMADKLSELFSESTAMNQKLIESEKQLHCLAFYDGLTGLPNRHYFQNYVTELIAYDTTKQMAIIFLDLNQFKQINDTLGHDAGDTLLQLTAEKLRVLKNDDREVFRLGGDEFVIVHRMDHKDEVAETIDFILNLFSSYFEIHGQMLYITASIGVSMYPENGKDLNTLVKFADIAMYISKERGGNIVQFFDESMKGKFQEQLLIENALRAVVDKGDFEQYYQPKVLLGEITSTEALLRWNDPHLGYVSPALFIPIAEEMGLIAQIDEWSLRRACKQNKQWQEEESLFIPVSVNISAKHFQQDYLVPMVKKALDESGLAPQYLKLEITESVFIRNPDHVADIIHRIKDMGVQISIDDFGKGYSSLYQLLHLPIDEIKIDRQFIKDIHQNDKKALLVSSILDMAHGLQLNVVAEGVETKSENDVLMQLGCDEIQGYLFSPPLCKEDIVKLMHAERNRV